MQNDGYADRRFRNYQEVTLRQSYEQHGMYRAQFPNVESSKCGPDSVCLRIF